jgi:putative AlgH/UPF0301 family transcriptional regulator
MKKYITALLFWVLCIGGTHAADIASAVTLIATERQQGTPYAQTVLLAVPDGSGQHMGLILNRPTDVELASSDATGSHEIVAPVFFGGPVMSGMLLAAVRANDPPSPHSIALMPGLFLVTDSETVGSLLKTASAGARYFTGFVVWQAAELEAEVRTGMWQMRPANVAVLFRPNPQRLWLELARERGQLVLNY